MKRFLFLLILIPVFGFSQYSSYYNVDINSKVSGTVNLNKNVNISGHTTQTINKIDYGALALANAEREKTRLEALQYADNKSRQRAIEIALNPVKAFDYGIDNNWVVKGKTAKLSGFKKYTYYHKIPHKSLFTRINNGYNYQNISDNGVETIIMLFGAYRFEYTLKTQPNNAFIQEVKEKGLEETMLMEEVKVGEINTHLTLDLKNAFVHKKDLNKATIFGLSGFVSTVIFEDDYEKVIIDYYNSKSGDYMSGSRVIFKGDKDEVSFEDLEGRRYYFNKLIERIIGSAQYIDIK